MGERCDFCSLLQFGERNLQLRPAGQDNAALDKVFELAHIARPVVFRQSRHGLGGDRIDGLFHPPRMLLREVARQQRDVFAPIAQRGDHHRKNVEPVEEIAAKLVLRHLLRQIHIGGGHQANIHTDRARAAETLELLFLKNTQQLRLKI